jgi:hypothetical protein
MYNKDEDIEKRKTWGESDNYFLVYFALQFAFIAAGMFVSLKVGVMTMLITLMIVPFIMSRATASGFGTSRSDNIMVYLFGFMGLFYLFEVLNPNNVQAAWNIAIAHYWLYPFAMALVVPLAIRNVRGIEILLIIWSVFIIMATMKGYWQKSHGFNANERYFLYVLGGWRTHIIWSGIRYFSFFSDAANYGVHCALASSVLGISAIHIKKFSLKVLFTVAALCGIYSMAISGTRAAMGVPLAALAFYVVLSKNVKGIIGGAVFLLTLFCFFYFTNIGNGNQYVRKMRSAFRPDKDASYMVRVENRRHMKELMATHIIGYGVGLSKGERFSPRELMPYPPDSWLVSVWVETGIVGLILYLAIHGVLFAWCSWLLLFKIRDKQLRGLLIAWLCMAAGFFLATYVNDVMQYPNSIAVYTSLALCLAGPHIDKAIAKEKEEKEGKNKEPEETKPKYTRYYKNIKP